MLVRMSATGQEVEVPHEYVKPATGMLAGRPGTHIAAADDAITVASPTTVVSVQRTSTDSGVLRLLSYFIFKRSFKSGH